MSIYNKAKVIALAAAHIHRTGCSWSQALKSAWGTHKEEVLATLLSTHEAVKFTYQKSKGELREAVGTLLPSVIDRHGCTPKKAGRTASCLVFTYFDLIAQAWRCFNHGLLLKVIGPVAVAA